MIAIPALLLFAVLLVFFWGNAPRCWTCKKRKIQMHLTDKLDCMSCHLKNEARKP